MQITTRQDIFDFVKRKYKTTPEYLWPRYTQHAVLRRADNRKWYAIIMSVSRKTMRANGDGMIGVINVKCDPILMGMLMGGAGYRPAYHMSKSNWISILLDGSVPRDEIFNLIQQSYNAVK